MPEPKIYKAYLKFNDNQSIDYNDCYIKFEEILLCNNEKIEFEIIAEQKIIDFDLTIIGYLVLLKKSKPYLETRIILENNYYTDSNKKAKSIIWKIRQSIVHTYYASSNTDVFSVVDGDGEVVDFNKEEKRKNYKQENYSFFYSKEFLPIIFIDEKNYKKIFEKVQEFQVIQRSENNLTSENYHYLYCRKLLTNNISDNNYIQILSQLAFYRSLESLKSLRYYFNTETNEFRDLININSIQVGYISDNTIKEKYWKEIIPVFKKLKELPPIYSLIFSILVCSKRFKIDEFKKNEIEKITNNILTLWEFTKKLVFGINELAKNIIDHSSTRQGIITGYINKSDQFRINIFDFGKKNIITTLKESTRNKIESFRGDVKLKNIYEEDFKKLTNNNFDFSLLFKSDKTQMLNQQAKRATAHLGLLIFSHLVTSNNGNFYVSSCGNNRKDIYPEKETSFKYFHIGTNYQVLLNPLHKEDNNLSSIEPVSQQSAEDALSIEKLLSWEIDGNKECIFVDLTLQQKTNIEDELWTNFQNAISSKELGNKNIFVCFKQIEKKINSSQLFRFLGKWEIFFQKHNLVIYDIDIKLYFELYEINKSFVSQTNTLPYWNTNAITLFYCFIKIKNNKFYFTDALWGKAPKDFIFINTLIHKNNYNALFHYPDFSENKDNPIHSLDNKIFVNDSTLLPFDLVIKDKYETTLFEKNAKVLLNNELKLQKDYQKEEDNPIRHIENQIHNLPGFKIKDTHFRLGSKIHITDFYYAKRFFQNSFYASRFAFVVTKYILKEKLLKKEYDELTLVGYGLYSELLLSTVVRYISKYYEQNKNSKIKINHNLYTDTEEMNLVKGYEEIYKNIIIIVPIASTFSTSMKIAETLKERNKDINIINPHINILAITNGDIKMKGKVLQNEIEKKYGWNEVFPKEKTVDVTSFNSGENIFQKYFIPLESKWYDIENCVKCSPQKVENNCKTNICNDCNKKNVLNECPLSEQPLLMTDKTSVTPTLIFDFPRAREIFEENKNRKYKLSLKALKYGHIERNYQHFHYHIIDEVFLKDNPKISNWLKEEVANKIKSEIINYDVTDNVLIIAPKHFSNSQFVQMVNGLLFDNSANILHYDFWNNNIENFQMFYSKTVCDAKKIFFVDDTIISGSTFLKSNDFIKKTRKHNDNEKSYGFDACFFLINRTNNFTQTNINRKLKDKSCIFSFANINLPALDKNINGKCPICLNYDKIIKLFEDSYLSRFKNEFAERIKSIKLEGITSTTSNNENKEQAENNKPFENYNQNLIKVEFIHRIYEYFRTEKNQSDFDDYNNIDDWYKHLISEKKTPFIKSYIKENNENNISSNTDILLKVLAHSPFNQYKPIKEKVFKWTILSLNEQVEYLKNNNFENCDYLDFRRLKYFIRRVGLINSNYLISERFFHFITLLYKSNWFKDIIKNKNDEIEELENKIEEEEENSIFKTSYSKEFDKLKDEKESIEKNINSFSTFIISQIKELLFQNETRCILLEKYIEDYLTKLEEQKESSFDLKQFFRILKEENGILIQKFWEFYKTQDGLQLEEKLEKITKQNHYQYNTLCDFLKEANENKPKQNELLKTYLKTQSIFEEYKNNGKNNKSIKERTENICSSLETLFFSEKEENKGAFLLVKYRQDDKAELNNLFLAHNSGEYSQIIEDNWQEDNYIKKFIDGVTNGKNTSITIDLLEKQINSVNQDITWKSLFSKPNDKNINVNFFEKCENINYVLIAKLALKEIDDNSDLIINQQGVLVFYSDKNDFKPSKIRYLILLLKSISTFINEHHKNDEFRDWVESEKRLKEANRLQAIANEERNKYEQLLVLYNERFGKFAHGAKHFINDLHDEIKDNKTEIILLLSYLVNSHINIGEFYQKILQEKKKKKEERIKLVSGLGMRKHEISFSDDFIKALKQIELRNSNHKIVFNDSISNKFYTKIPYAFIEYIVFECISNALSDSHDRRIEIHIDFVNDLSYLKITSIGKQIKSTFDLNLFKEHLKSEEPNLEYGIGLYVVNNIINDVTNKQIEIETIIKSNIFIVKVPLV